MMPTANNQQGFNIKKWWVLKNNSGRSSIKFVLNKNNSIIQNELLVSVNNNKI